MGCSKASSFKQKLIDWILENLVKFVSLFPLSAVQRLGLFISRVTMCFPNTSMVRVARINIDLCFPGWQQEAKKNLLKKTISQAVITGIEMPYLFMRPPEVVLEHIVSDKGAKAVRKALANKKGVLMVGPHIGSWEIAIMYLSKNFPTSILYTPQKIPKIDEIIYKARTRFGVKMMPANASGIKQLYQALGNNEVVVLLTDQVPPNGKGATYVPFFNIGARTMNFPTKLYNKYQPEVFLVYCIRLGIGQGFEMRFEPLAEDIVKSEKLAEVEDTFAHACSVNYERIILEQPEQYQWIYKRFKHQPEGVLDYYQK